MKKIIFTISLAFFLSVPLFAETYWIDNDSGGKSELTSCKGEIPLNGSNACYYKSVSYDGATVKAGDTVYFREGTYNITESGINPTNSGTSKESMIIFSSYQDENVTFYGVRDISGYASAGIKLRGNSYIKITKIDFINVKYGFTIHGGGYNEISYCNFEHRNAWNDVIITGTAKNNIDNYYHSSSVLYDPENDLSKYANRRIINLTDKSVMYSIDTVTTTTASAKEGTSRELLGGTNNYWSYGDKYQITWNNSYDPAPCDIGGASTNNWIHHNTMQGPGGFQNGQDGVPVFQIGSDLGGAEYNNNNTVEYNHIFRGGHHTAGINKGLYNVIKHNYFTNHSWFDDSAWGGGCTEQGLCGYRVVSSGVDEPAYGGYGLWEGNRIAHGAAYGGPHLINDSSASGGGVSLGTPNNIYRYNEHVHNALYGLRLGSSVSSASNNNRVYNNTFYKNGYGADDDPRATNDEFKTGLIFYRSGTEGNIIKNNLFYDHYAQTNKPNNSTYTPAIRLSSEADLDNNTIENNYLNSTSGYISSPTKILELSNPLFEDDRLPAEDADYIEAMEVVEAWPNVVPNLSLKKNSPAINKGTFLTRAVGAGADSTILTVEDSRYFQDGSWGSDLANLHPDVISIGTVTNIVTIQAIDYDKNIITLESPISWNENDPIWLKKNSDGKAVLFSDAPDMGANETWLPPTISRKNSINEGD